MAERHVADERGMARLGRELAGCVTAPAVIHLRGPLGAGKTTLVRAWLHALGHEGPVRSPSYTLVETYALAGIDVHHLDLYRVTDPEELELIGIRDLAGPRALWLVEWPERGGDRLPPPDHVLELAFEGQGRRLSGLPAALATETS